MLDQLLISFFITFPEGILMLLIGFSLSGIKVSIKKIVLISGIQAIIGWMILIFDVPFGMNTIVTILSLCFIVSLILKIKLNDAILPILIGFFISGISQVTISYIANTLFFKFQYYTLRNNFTNSFLFFLPTLILLIIVCLIVKRKKCTIM